MKWLADWLIRRSLHTPYFHLLHGDGTVYMERYWLRPYSDDRRGYAARIHHIASPDYDRVFHDHPWDFLSIILRGGYTELRPVEQGPCFEGDEERSYATVRKAGSIAFRRATDRHRIVSVEPDTWTLFLTGPKRHWWGFYTPTGKVYWRDYPSVHEADAAAARVAL